MQQQPSPIDVSFALASYNSLPYLDAAIESALAQVNVSVEVLVVDDHGSDGSLARARDWAERDARIRVFQTPANGGPGAARNVAIAQMRGQWYAVLDADDLVDPARSRDLIDKAEEVGADLVADDLILFGEGMEDSRFLPAYLPSDGHWIDLERYFASTILFGSKPNLGFLKPMIRTSVLREKAISYDTRLRIAEDDEFILQLLMAGCRYYLWPQPGYRYRKHEVSISHRLSLAHAEAMLASEERLRERLEGAGLLGAAYRKRYNSIRSGVAFTRSIEQLKQREPLAALRTILSTPSAAGYYSMPIAARFKRVLQRGAA